MNFLFCSAGIFTEIINEFRMSLGASSKFAAVGNSSTQAALYAADKRYVVPGIAEEGYIPAILEICKKEEIDAVLTFSDADIEILSANRNKFNETGAALFMPEPETARICGCKYSTYEYLTRKGIKTMLTFNNIDAFLKAFESGKIEFPVFVKPDRGCGSVRARKISGIDELEFAFKKEDDLVIQEYVDGFELDVDVYVDYISRKTVSVFAKRKLLTSLGGTKIAYSYIDGKLFKMVEDIVSAFEFCGPVDMEFLCRDGEYYLLEINPRFSAAYPHAYSCGVDFPKMIENNLMGIENLVEIGNYEENVFMMKYESLIVKKMDDLAKKY